MTVKKKSDEDLAGLGSKSMQALGEIGIYSRDDLEKIGAIRAYVRLKQECKTMKPSLNFLYALVGALESRDWRDVAKNDKGRLLMELEGFEALEKMTTPD